MDEPRWMDHPANLRANAMLLQTVAEQARWSAVRIEHLQTALRVFMGCAYPVATEINPRGHAWRSEASLDYALSEARKVVDADRPATRTGETTVIADVSEKSHD